MRWEVRLAGFGGQGIVLAGFILGKATALYDNKDAIFTQAYGPEARGGACSAELVIADEEIDYPEVRSPDALVIMSQEASDKYGGSLRSGGTVLVDEDLVSRPPSWENIHRVPFTRMADELGRRIVANVVMLGSFTAVTGIVGREAMEEAIRTSVRERVIDLNMRAFAAGYDYAKSPEAVR